MTDPAHRVSVVLFDGFELLDVFGPVELLSRLPQQIGVDLLGPGLGPVRSSQGSAVVAEVPYDSAGVPDVVMVPGGIGTRTLVDDDRFLSWLTAWAQPARLITSVCTGSALLAAAGLLDGFRATSNKRAFDGVRTHGENVEWVARARWVQDRNRWTSSGVAAGMDMTAALIGHLCGETAALDATREIELEVHADSTRDPFADYYGLA